VSMVLADPEPRSLVAVHGQCEAIEAWAAESTSVAELRDAGNKLAAIDEYLARTSIEGRARVAAAMRRLEVRVGELLPRQPGRRTDLEPPCRDTEVLSEDQRKQFRKMAEHPEVVEQVIAESTDERPPSRRSVLQRLADTAREHPIPAARRRPRAERAEQIAALALAGHTSRQIAEQLGVDAVYVRALAREEGITLADAAIGKTRRPDANRIVNETVTALEGLTLGLQLVEVTQLDRDQVDAWATSLSNSLRSLNRLAKQLKEMARG
jgi:DNA-binding CsgD family transcriptional regulator